MALEPYPEWLAQFDGQALPDKVGVAAILGTTDGEGWSHLAYLSVGDILVQNGRLSLILWPSSETCRNLRRTGQAVLHVAAGGAVWEARLTLHPRAGDDARGAVFDGEIVGQRRHAAPYADVLGLVSFRLHDAPATIERWADKLAALRAVA
jgi:hypothetical protein